MPYRYRPRQYMVNPKSFGRHPEAIWKPHEQASPKEQVYIAASYLQHLAACETLRAAANKTWDIADLARRVPTVGTVDTLRRKLYGDVPATFDDIVAWALAVGEVTVLPAPADTERMLPPER